uniref:NADH dehydrogenase subunit 6 n=1 Tax=Gobionotothen gibberifrons TaxID=36202 RepID=UPI0022FD84B5|nr:NADH dehydrogenase subunit 6 [Gobionotothen gibberifrons]WBF91128.1 NADH dehydrogenase subunit 6 [Gobionotothen gibberifrons]
MLVFGYLLMLGLMVGMATVASNPSPFYAALGLVVVAAIGCGLIMCLGGTFSCLVLFLIYLGGMLVVFAYSVALCAEAPSTGLGKEPVSKSVLGCFGVALGLGVYQVSSDSSPPWWGLGDELEMAAMQGETEGVSEAYGYGGALLIVCAWALLMALFVALEVARGRMRGTVRSIK